jgi:transcriptional regulator
VYTPSVFETDDTPAMHDVIRRHPLGLLITAHSGDLHTTHLPFHLVADSEGSGTLEAHLARVNPHCEALRTGAPSIVVFNGPDAYISPRCYLDPAANVPTWNYVAIHAHGRPRTFDDSAAVLRIISTLTDEHEAYIDKPWRIDEARPHAERLLSQVLAFEIKIERLEGKFKLSQNRLAGDRAGVMRALGTSSLDTHQEMLEMMEKLYTADGLPHPA